MAKTITLTIPDSVALEVAQAVELRKPDRTTSREEWVKRYLIEHLKLIVKEYRKRQVDVNSELEIT